MRSSCNRPASPPAVAGSAGWPIRLLWDSTVFEVTDCDLKLQVCYSSIANNVSALQDIACVGVEPELGAEAV